MRPSLLHFFSLTLLGLSVAAGEVSASPLSLSQAEQALTNMFPRMNKGDVQVFEVSVCVPTFKKPQGDWTYAVDFRIPGRGPRATMLFVFHRQGEIWSIDSDADTPGACAPNEVAQTVFRAASSDSGLQVLGEVGHGEGRFTSDRGVKWNEGPMRLMCRYNVRTGSGENLQFIAYLQHDGQSYLIDPDWEIRD